VNKKGRFIIILTVILSLGVILISCAPRGEGSKMETIFIKMLDKTAAKLNLNPEQKAEFAKLKAEVSLNFRDGWVKRQEIVGKIKEEASQKQPDIQKMTNLLQKMLNDDVDDINEAFGLMIDFMPKLNESQKRHLTQMISSWVSKWK
jgi:hypothetical protein